MGWKSRDRFDGNTARGHHGRACERLAGKRRFNVEWEYRRNQERYAFLRWSEQAFDGFRVVPPGMGICHQVNLEHLGRVVRVQDGVAFSAAGIITTQFIATPAGWRMTAMAWDDERPGLSIPE